MRSSPTKKFTPDRGHIETSEKNAVKYMSRHLGVSREELRRAIEKVGNSTASVRKELDR